MKVILACWTYGHMAEYEIDENANGGIYPCVSVVGMPWCPSNVVWKGKKNVKTKSRESTSQAD
jgi:hypothetical protein